MSRPAKVRQYGKQSKKSRAERLFAELPQSPVRKPLPKPSPKSNDAVADITSLISAVKIRDEEDILDEIFKKEDGLEPRRGRSIEVVLERRTISDTRDHVEVEDSEEVPKPPISELDGKGEDLVGEDENSALRILTWDDVCPFGDSIEKIAEASYAEVYRVTNSRGISIIKVIRLESPIKPQTKAQEKAQLVDEEPHPLDDLLGELQISEWLADIPGFVVYKDNYIVKGKAPKALLETHQAFHRKAKRNDPDRLQFYPSPSRYLEDTKFLVVELGDAGAALEDFQLDSSSQLWDIFFLVAIALARAEDLVCFEHRDLHEGNLCIKTIGDAGPRNDAQSDVRFGYSGLDITILDYGLSRAEDLTADEETPVAYDLEKDLSIFTSTHADQCKVYRQMRSFLLHADRKFLPPSAHNIPYATGIDGNPISWDSYAPYTNVLWLAYIYDYLIAHFVGEKKELVAFKRETKELWTHLNPAAKAAIPCFGSAGDVVRFAVAAGWILEEQLVGDGSTFLADREDSIIVSLDGEGDETSLAKLRRSPRRK